MPAATAKIISNKIKPKITFKEDPIKTPGLKLNQKFNVKKFPIFNKFNLLAWLVVEAKILV